jgi:ABC-type branched-subunit amino acid transport system ATPase component
LAVVLVEQNLTIVGDAASRVVILDKGVIAHQNSIDGFRREPDVADRLLGLSAE